MDDLTPPVRPRKYPRQRRSEVTVEAILQATARILGEEGFDALTTNRVAEVAGVSIGSLYQYFPNKEALVATLVENHVSYELALLEATLEAVWQAPLEEAVRELIEVFVANHQADLRLTRALHAELPRLGLTPALIDATRAAEARLVEFFLDRSDELGVREPPLAAFLVVNAVEALHQRLLLERPEIDVASFVAELARMIVGYLRTSPEAVAAV